MNNNPVENCNSPYLRADQIEPMVWNTVKSMLSNPEEAFNAFRNESVLSEERAKSIQGRLDYIDSAIKKLEVAKKRITEAFKAEAMTLQEFRKEKTEIELSEEKLICERDGLSNKLNVQHNANAKIDLFQETCHRFLSKINDPKIVTERLKKDIIKLIIDEVVVEGEKIKIFATIPFPNKIEEREISRKDLPGTFNAGATLGPINQTKMERIWTKHKNTDTTLKPKVFVGMSGGVDSSVSAALLIKAGFDVTGVFIKVWQPDWIECTWREERREAMRVAAHLGIPFITLDLEKEYKEGVIDYMISEYRAGRTPNPDVMCNREVKFGAFWRWAEKQGADYVATGHYAQVKKVVSSKQKTEFKMLAGVDKNKDQTYFLWTLDQDDLKHVFFPVGHLQKSDVRKLALKFKLPNADKKDSQGLCFIGKIDVKDFLKHYIKGEIGSGAGNVLNEKGEIIGNHPGSLFITIGERHGFTIDPKFKTPNDDRYYVVSKDVEKNTVTVGNKILDQVLRTNAEVNSKRKIMISRVNWTCEVPKVGDHVQVRVRYRQPLVDATIESVDNSSSNSSAVIIPVREIDAVTPGQSLVIYKGEECFGGGIIEV